MFKIITYKEYNKLKNAYNKHKEDFSVISGEELSNTRRQKRLCEKYKEVVMQQDKVIKMLTKGLEKALYSLTKIEKSTIT